MHPNPSWLPVLAIATTVALSACGGSSPDDATTSHHQPAKVEEIAGSDLKRLTLEPRAVERLDIRVARIAERAPGRTTVPYAAVIYDTAGTAFTYITPEKHVYQRTPIKVESVRGDVAILSQGPPAGTSVVSVGAAMLYGEELGVGH